VARRRGQTDSALDVLRSRATDPRPGVIADVFGWCTSETAQAAQDAFEQSSQEQSRLSSHSLRSGNGVAAQALVSECRLAATPFPLETILASERRDCF